MSNCKWLGREDLKNTGAKSREVGNVTVHMYTHIKNWAPRADDAYGTLIFSSLFSPRHVFPLTHSIRQKQKRNQRMDARRCKARIRSISLLSFLGAVLRSLLDDEEGEGSKSDRPACERFSLATARVEQYDTCCKHHNTHWHARYAAPSLSPPGLSVLGVTYTTRARPFPGLPVIPCSLQYNPWRDHEAKHTKSWAHGAAKNLNASIRVQ